MMTSAVADEGKMGRDKAYIDQVVDVLRSHVIAMRMILDYDDLKYADNMVRHAEALERAFGMIGPMEWHAAESFQYMQKSDAPEKLTEHQFEALADNSHTAISQIKRSAKRYMRDKNKKLMRKSIDDMIKSCGGCHSKMPEGVVPSVWKGLKE
jgi:hypothetical protein